MISSLRPLSVLPLLQSGRLRRNVTRTLLILKRWACSKPHFMVSTKIRLVWHHRRLDNGDSETSFYISTILHWVSWQSVRAISQKTRRAVLCINFDGALVGKEPWISNRSDFYFDDGGPEKTVVRIWTVIVCKTGLFGLSWFCIISDEICWLAYFI